MPIHVTVELAKGGVDWTAIVSAGAAVVQAFGAVAAIIYSGKLARDAASREIAADEANARRIKEADAAAEIRRDQDFVQLNAIREREDRERHNGPINQAVQFARAALEDFEATLASMRDHAKDQYSQVNPTASQELFIERSPKWMADALTPGIAAAIKEAVEWLQPFPQSYIQSGPDWSRALEPKVEGASEAIRALEAMRQ